MTISEQAPALPEREIEALADLDPRIVARPALDTPGAVWRLRRWLDAGKPSADLYRLSYQGSDAVRSLLWDVLDGLPAPVQWHAIEAVCWLEVGRSALAWCSGLPPARVLPRDVPHLVVLCGGMPDHRLPSIVCHELAHSLHRDVTERVAEVALTARDAAIYQSARMSAMSPDERQVEIDRWLHEQVAHELLADRQAAAWGHPVASRPVQELTTNTRQHFFDVMRELDLESAEGIPL